MKRWNAAPRPGGQPIFLILAQHEDRPLAAVHHPARDDAEHATMPVLAVVDQRAFRVADGDLLAQLADLHLYLLPFRVLFVELARKIASLRLVARQEQLN